MSSSARNRRSERRTATVNVGDEGTTVAYRLLDSAEARDVVTTVGHKKLGKLVEGTIEAVGETDVETVERYQQLASVAIEDVSQLSEDERTEFVELSEELDDVETGLLTIYDDDVTAGMRKVIEYTVEPDKEDRKERIVSSIVEVPYAAFSLGFKIFTESMNDGNINF